MNELSTFLFARPTFREGWGRLLDFGNTLSEYNRSATPQEADRIAITADCEVVASELLEAIEVARGRLASVKKIAAR